VATMLLSPSVRSPHNFPRCSTTPLQAEIMSVSRGMS
jgi:hypothetical protein